MGAIFTVNANRQDPLIIATPRWSSRCITATPSQDKSAPLTRILTPSDRTRVARAFVTITATAYWWRGDSRRRGLVERGQTRHPATGDGNSEATTGRSRRGGGTATTMDVNLEMPKKRITVSYGPAPTPTASANHFG